MCNNTNYGAFICYSPLSGYLLLRPTPPAAAHPAWRAGGVGWAPFLSRGPRLKQVDGEGLGPHDHLASPPAPP